MLTRKIILLISMLMVATGHSQVTVSGTIREKTDVLPGASIKALNTDSSFVTGTATDMEGNFRLVLPGDKNYILVYSFLGYRTKYRNLALKTTSISLPPIVLAEDDKNLSEVQVTAVQTRGEQKGDTTQFNAGAYKTNPDASAEDLIKKMPGITSDNTGLKVNGENVQKVLVDGKPFFGDDPNAALKNLPADIIDKVEVFDKLSDQAQFTGFSDGEQKTINIVTKKGKNQGQFGKVFAGYGVDEDEQPRYQSGAALNSFKEQQRVTLLLLSNNINQQNFSAADITGATGAASQRSGGRGGGSPLLTSPLNGNTTTQSAGLNYSDEWTPKMKVSGSYFYNNTINRNVSGITRSYFTDNHLAYFQQNNDLSKNQNHRANFRFEYEIDSSNKLTIVPSLNLQNNGTSSALTGSNTILDNILLSKTRTNSENNNLGYDFNNSVLYQHKFNKVGRTISVNVSTFLNEKNNDGSYNSANEYSDTSTTGLNQLFKTYGNNKRGSLNISYTEPVKKYGQIQVSYLPSYSTGSSDKRTRDFSSFSNNYTDLNTALSNKYDNIYETQRAGVAYKYRKEKLYATIGSDVQQSTLSGDQTYPRQVDINQRFQNILPSAMLRYKFSKSKNLRINYRTSTNIPSIAQLQSVIDISNPLQIRSGNAALKQTFENNLYARYGGFDQKTSRNIMIFLNGNITNNYISNGTYILKNDSNIQGYEVKAGSQLTKPVNLNGFYSGRTFFVYGLPVGFLKSNVNFNAGVNYNHTPTLINDRENISNTYATNAGLFVGSNISEKIDFSIGYNANYTIVKNSLQKQSDNNYFTHVTTFKLNVLMKGFVINSDISHTLFNGLSQSYNQQYLLWNAYVGYKFMKNQSLEAKVSVFDILNQNRSISRTVTGAYTEDSFTNVLRRYGMFTLTYTFKHFKAGSKMPEAPKQEYGGGRMHH
jgi:hypothetical protein